MTVFHRLAAIAILLAAVAVVPACVPHATVARDDASGGLPAGNPPASAAQKVGTVAGIVAPALVDAQIAVAPKSAAAIAKACPAVESALSIAAACVSGGAAGATGAIAQANNIVTPSCTKEGQAALIANDVAAATTGPTATNSGDSASYVLGFLALAAKVAPLGCPIGKALLGLS